MSRTWQIQLGTPANRRQVQMVVRACAAECALSLGRDHESALDRLLVDPAAGRIYLVEVRGEPAGFVNVVFQHSIAWGGRLSIVEKLFLLPAHRGRGLAQRVLRAVIGDLENLGPSIVAAYVAEDDPLGQVYDLEVFEKTPLIRFSDQALDEDSPEN